MNDATPSFMRLLRVHFQGNLVAYCTGEGKFLMMTKYWSQIFNKISPHSLLGSSIFEYLESPDSYQIKWCLSSQQKVPALVHRLDSQSVLWIEAKNIVITEKLQKCLKYLDDVHNLDNLEDFFLCGDEDLRIVTDFDTPSSYIEEDTSLFAPQSCVCDLYAKYRMFETTADENNQVLDDETPKNGHVESLADFAFRADWGMELCDITT